MRLALAQLNFTVGAFEANFAKMRDGIAQARAGNHLHDVSAAVQQHVEAAGFSVVRDLVGHGIGSQFHEEPQIPNYRLPHRGPRLLAGMTLAIEPMINLGRPEVRTKPDKWTVVTMDGSLSAHFEHTVLITEDGARILTKQQPALQTA